MYRTVLAALLVLAASALALDRPDAPGGIHMGTRVASQAYRSQALTQTQEAPPPASAMLERMSPAERENSCISVEFENSDAELIALGREVERCGTAASTTRRSHGSATSRTELAQGMWQSAIPGGSRYRP